MKNTLKTFLNKCCKYIIHNVLVYLILIVVMLIDSKIFSIFYKSNNDNFVKLVEDFIDKN